VSRLSRQCGILNIPQSYRPPRPVKGIALLFLYWPSNYRSRDIVVGKATGYELDDRGGRSSSSGGVKNFIFSTASRLAMRPTLPPIQYLLAALSPTLKRPVREADHSPPTNAEVKKTWIYTIIPHAFSRRSARYSCTFTTHLRLGNPSSLFLYVFPTSPGLSYISSC
jgi:hypothetical protein